MFVKAALVVDPVMVSTSGDTLSGSSTLAKYRYKERTPILFFMYFTEFLVECYYLCILNDICFVQG
jgi:hypothetical protein